MKLEVVAKYIINNESCATTAFFQYKYLFIFTAPEDITTLFNSQAFFQNK